MKRLFSVVLTSVISIIYAFGQSVASDMAISVATSFMQDRGTSMINAISIDSLAVDNVVCSYIVRFSDGSWCVVSSDERTLPIPTYGFSSDIFEELPESFLDI